MITAPPLHPTHPQHPEKYITPKITYQRPPRSHTTVNLKTTYYGDFLKCFTAHMKKQIPHYKFMSQVVNAHTFSTQTAVVFQNYSPNPNPTILPLLLFSSLLLLLLLLWVPHHYQACILSAEVRGIWKKGMHRLFYYTSAWLLHSHIKQWQPWSQLHT